MEATEFITMYAGVDPKERARLLVRSIVKIPINYEKYKKDDDASHILCLEETTIEKNFVSQYPTVQIQLRKLPRNFTLDQRDA